MIEIKTIHANLSNEEKVILIQLFYDLYFNTDQDVEEFSVEFYGVAGALLSGSIPVALEFIEEFEQAVINKLPRLESIFDLEEGDINKWKM